MAKAGHLYCSRCNKELNWYKRKDNSIAVKPCKCEREGLHV